VTPSEPYPPIADYALLGDCHSAALVSLEGSVDWCCMPRLDAASIFGRILDWERGGYCLIAPADEFRATRRYIDHTMILETTFETDRGSVRLLDGFSMRAGGRLEPHRQLLRVVDGVAGEVPMRVVVSARLDYGELRPWLRSHGEGSFTALGGNDGLLVWSDWGLEVSRERDDLLAGATVREGQRKRVSIEYVEPQYLDPSPPHGLSGNEVDERLDQTFDWWRRWSEGGRELAGPYAEGVRRSAIVLKALTHAPTGAVAAAPTTSLPEVVGGERNWDYRYSWIRDSTFAVRSLGVLGHDAEADGFRRFVERSAAGHADDLQIVYGIGGERRLTELVLHELEGYRGSRPVRIGNAASRQIQLDVYGELLDLAWRWHLRGHPLDREYWRFLTDLANAASEMWKEPDHGLWEVRSEPEHFVHSKAMCWAAVDRALRLVQGSDLDGPVTSWAEAREEIREAIERDGYDGERGVFVRAFGSRGLDASLLLLPTIDFVGWDDERMVRTVDAIHEDLEEGGLVRRYLAEDGLIGDEGTFVACTFWLAECLARQGRLGEAQASFDRACEAGNDLGLFAEEFDPATGELLGNFPQALTHLSHITASVALMEGSAAAEGG